MKFKFTWAHAVALVLLSFMGFILSLIFLAGDTGDLVSDDYYEESLVYQEQSYDARQRAQELTQKPTFNHQANGILIQFPVSEKIDSASLFLLRNADKNLDLKLPLQLNPKNQALVPAAQLKTGNYEAKLNWKMNQKSFLIIQSIEWNTP